MLDHYDCRPFEADGKRRPVYWRGSGPGVLLMHELPAIHETTVELGDHLVSRGFTVVMPVLLGEPGRTSPLDMGIQLVRACLSREFACLAAHRSSPITDWLRALCREVHERCGGPGVGAIGMCLTGNFALALMVDERVMAPILSQPSLPFPIGAARKRALGISDADLAIVEERVRGGCPMLGLRFTHDWMCPDARFERLRERLGPNFEPFPIDSSPGNPHGISPRAHSVLTLDRVARDGHPTEEALERVVALLTRQLLDRQEEG